MFSSGVGRIIDANINRLKEGLRVCEEICRFILISRGLTADIKKIRHKVDALFRELLPSLKFIQERDALKDIGKNIYINELKRKDSRDIFFANIQRAKESTRVLEEFSKLLRKETAIKFKDIRYVLYEIEQRAAKKLSTLRNNR